MFCIELKKGLEEQSTVNAKNDQEIDTCISEKDKEGKGRFSNFYLNQNNK